jgi:competence protein ComEC
LERWGLVHLLAVSGLHVGLVAVLAWLLGSFCLPRRWRPWRLTRLVPPAVAVLGYLLLVGPRPSLLRASAMALLALGALVLRRPPSAGNALALFVLVGLLLRPVLVEDLGFALSVGATAALVWGTPRFVAAWSSRAPGGPGRGWPGGVRALAATTAAQLGTWPWALPAFHLMVPAAPLANLLAVPWAAVMLAAAMLWCALALAAPPVAAALVPALDLLAAPVPLLADLPPLGWEALPWGGGLAAVAPVPVAWLFSLAAGCALLHPRRGLPCLLLALAVGWCHPVARPQAVPELRLLDVGQGDALLLRDGERAVLIDGGSEFPGRALLPVLLAAGVDRLDGMLLTHPDRDHCGGLTVLADLLPVAWVFAATEGAEGECGGWLAGLRDRQRLTVLTPGDTLPVGRWQLEVLHPPAGSGGGDNDRSLVLSATVPGGRRVLLTGDIEAVAERQILQGAAPVASDVLKVAHHGSKTSSIPAFLDAVAPRMALLSAGRGNPYHHPAPPILRRLERRGVRVLRTDLHGQVILRFFEDGRMVLWTAAAPGAQGERVR